MKNYKILQYILITIIILGGLFSVNHTAKAQNVSVTGYLMLPDNTTAVSYAYLYIYNSNWSSTQSAYTDSAGLFNFYNLPAGSYTLQVYAYNSTYSDPDPISLTVTSSETTDLGTINLLNKNITGTLTLPDGVTGVPNIYMYLRNSTYTISKSAYSDSNGNFGFALSTAGTYTISVWSAYGDYAPPTDYSFTYSGSGSLTVGPIKFNNKNLIGTFTLPDGTTPVSGGYAYAHNSSWTFSQSSSVNSTTGAFGFYVPTTGSYTIEFYGYNTAYPNPDPVAVTINDISVITDLGNIKLKEPNVNGRLTLPDGTTGVSSASVNLHSSDWSVYRYATTDSSGYFNFYLSTSGTYTMDIWASSSTYSNPDAVTFTFTAGSTVYYDGTNGSSVITLQAPGMQGRILKPDGVTGASYASVYVHDSSYNYNNSEWTSSDYDGYFKVKSLNTGTYTVEITPPYDSSQSLIGPDPFTVSLTKGTTNTDYLTNPIVLSQAQKTISGTVKYPNGSKVTDAGVSAWKNGNGYGYAYTNVDSNGNYTMKVGTGDWQISVWPTWSYGNQPDWGYYDPAKSAEFELANNVAESATVDFEVTKFSATLSGRILYPDGSVPPQSNYVSVSVWSQGGGGGNWSQIDSQGYFSMKLPPGTFNVNVYSSDNTYGAPDIAPVTLAEDEAKDLGSIKFTIKNEFIKGSITDTNGNALANQYVSSWKVSGNGWGWTQTDANGEYTLSVSTGRWEVQAYPQWSGNNTVNYVATQKPQEVVLTANQTKENVNFQFSVADATIQITVQDEDGNVLDNLYGWAFAEDPNQGVGEYWYGGIGGSVSSGSATIKVPAGSWRIGMWTYWGSDYAAANDTIVTIASGETKDAIVTLLPKNVTVTGKFYDTDGNIVDNVWGSVFADNGAGGYGWANIEEGAYSLKVTRGTWYLGYWVDQRYGYINSPIENNKLTVESGEEVSFDFILLKADSIISGTVLDPNGNPQASAWISADVEIGGKSTNEHSYWDFFHQGNISDANGHFSIQVPKGEYFVSASLPPDLGYINPSAQKVIVDSEHPAEVDLQFKQSDGQITGTVVLNNQALRGFVINGQAHEGFVWGWSEEGGYSEIYTNTGEFTLNVLKNQTWHIGANYDTLTTYYSSDEYIVDVPDSGIASQDIELKEGAELPAAQTATFSADTSKTMKLSDGTEIIMPAYSILNSTEDITVTATPTAQLPHQSKSKPIGIGYGLVVRYASGSNQGQTINSFASDVTIKLYYTDAQLEALGITEDEIEPMYYDETSGTYKPVDNVVIDKDNNAISFTVRHFTNFAIVTGKVTQQVSESELTIDLTLPLDNTVVTTDLVIVSGTVSDPDAQVIIRLNGTSVGTIAVDSEGAFSKSVSGLESGENTITVDAILGVDSAPTITRTVVYEESNDDLTPIDSNSGTSYDLLLAPNENGGPHIRVIKKDGTLLASFFAYSEALRGTFRAMAADVNNDGEQEIITYVGEGHGSQVRLFTKKGELMTQFFAYQEGFRGGMDILLGDVNNNGKIDLITFPLGNGGSNIRAYEYTNAIGQFELLGWFMAFQEEFQDKINVKLGDVTGDGKIDVIVAPQNSGGPNVRIYTYNTTTSAFDLVDWFMAYQEDYQGGVNILTGDLTGDGIRELVTWPAHEGGPNARVYQYNEENSKFEILDWFMAYQDEFRGEMNLVMGDLDKDGKAEIITAPATEGGPNVRIYTYNEADLAIELVDWFMAYQEDYKGGINLAVSNVDGDDVREVVVSPKENGGPNVRLYEYNLATNKLDLMDWFMAYQEGYRGEVGIKVADIDADGKSEIITTTLEDGGPNVRIWEYEDEAMETTSWFWGYAENFHNGVIARTID